MEFSFENVVQGTLHHIPDPTPSAPPYIIGALEQNFMDEFKAIVSNLVTEVENIKVSEGDQSTRIHSSNSQEINFQLPVVHLFKSNSEGNRAQFEILPEEFAPKSSRLPYPYMGAFGREDLDLESTGELLLKISLENIIQENPNIDTDRFINHLHEFYYRSQAINSEYLTRVRNKKPIFPNEASFTLKQFQLATNQHPRFKYLENSYPLDNYLLGNGNWRDASVNSIRPEVQRYLIWALDFMPNQKSLGWSEAE